MSRKQGIIFSFIAISACRLLFVLSHLQWWKFTWKLKHNSDPVSVRLWAEELRSQHKNDEEPYLDSKGTNLPPGIAGILPHHPFVVTGGDDNSLAVSWGRGDPAIWIYPTNFTTTNRFSEFWAPGIYLIKPHD